MFRRKPAGFFWSICSYRSYPKAPTQSMFNDTQWLDGSVCIKIDEHISIYWQQWWSRARLLLGCSQYGWPWLETSQPQNFPLRGRFRISWFPLGHSQVSRIFTTIGLDLLGWELRNLEETITDRFECGQSLESRGGATWLSLRRSRTCYLWSIKIIKFKSRQTLCYVESFMLRR